MEGEKKGEGLLGMGVEGVVAVVVAGAMREWVAVIPVESWRSKHSSKVCLERDIKRSIVVRWL
jgi:hypothetical protein